MGNLCPPIANTPGIKSQFGGFYANSIPFDCVNKLAFLVLFVVQILIVAAMYSFYLYEQNKTRKDRDKGQATDLYPEQTTAINDSDG